MTRAIGDAPKVARQKSVSRPVDATKGRGKSVAMKNGETKTVNGAEIKKLVVRASVAESGFGFSRGRRHFSLTSYIVKRDGREVGIARSEREAVALANKHVASEAERHARAVDIAAERAAREGKKNKADGRRVAAWREESTGKRGL